MELEDMSFTLQGNGFYFKIKWQNEEKEGIGNVIVISFEKVGDRLYPVYTVEDEEKGIEYQDIICPIFNMCKFIEMYPEGKEDLITRLRNKEITEEDLEIILPEGTDDAIQEIKKNL